MTIIPTNVLPQLLGHDMLCFVEEEVKNSLPFVTGELEHHAQNLPIVHFIIFQTPVLYLNLKKHLSLWSTLQGSWTHKSLCFIKDLRRKVLNPFISLSSPCPGCFMSLEYSLWLCKSAALEISLIIVHDVLARFFQLATN